MTDLNAAGSKPAEPNASQIKARVMDRAADAQDRFLAATADLESTIERNPLIAVLIALFVGLLIGALSRSRR